MYNNITSFTENTETGIQEKATKAMKRREVLQENVTHHPLENQDGIQLEVLEEKALHLESLQEELEAIKKQRDVLLAEKEEWTKERMSLKGEIESVVRKTRFSLCKLFSGSQVDYILSGIPIKRWTDEDMSNELTLRCLSPKAYRYLREMCKFPYPSKSTLNRRMSNVDVEPGVLTALLNILKCRAKEMTEPDRLCILSFDECSIAHAWSYDKGTDTLYSPKDRAQCVMIRGLVQPWRQLVFYDFDSNMTKEILFDLIEKIEAAGFNVVGMVSDLGPTNVKLWKTLGLGIENCSFRNPAAPDRDVYVFADAPHLI